MVMIDNVLIYVDNILRNYAPGRKVGKRVHLLDLRIEPGKGEPRPVGR